MTQTAPILAERCTCPGCGHPILVPAQPTADNWTDRPFWCYRCGGDAPIVLTAPRSVRPEVTS